MKSSWLDCPWSKYTGGNWGLLLQSHRALIYCRWDSQHQCSPGVSSQEKVSKCTMTLTGRKKKTKTGAQWFWLWLDIWVLKRFANSPTASTIWREKNTIQMKDQDRSLSSPEDRQAAGTGTAWQCFRAQISTQGEREKPKNHKVLPWSHHGVWLLCAPKPTTVLLVSPWHIHKACSKPALLPLFPCFFIGLDTKVPQITGRFPGTLVHCRQIHKWKLLHAVTNISCMWAAAGTHRKLHFHQNRRLQSSTPQFINALFKAVFEYVWITNPLSPIKPLSQTALSSSLLNRH